jgi:DeoR family transcriptional regulator of aga operon
LVARNLHQQRRASIADIARKTGFVRNSDLSERFGVSTVTIRQDIDVLSSQGVVHRTFGGAMFAAEGMPDTSFQVRSAEHRAAKARIGAAAASMILPGETILLDSGTTTMEIARRLPENADITLVTCALDIALEAGAKSGVTVIVCGGRLNPRTLSTADGETGKQLSQVFADRLFLGTYGIHPEKGLAERNHDVAQAKRALIAAARDVTLVCDASKFTATGPVIVAPITIAARVVTDTDLAPEQRNWLVDRGLAILTV